MTATGEIPREPGSGESAQPLNRRDLLRVAGLGVAGSLTGTAGADQNPPAAALQPATGRSAMDTEVIAHPRLQHYGLVTAKLDAMTDWYRKVLGMTVNNRAKLPPIARGQAPFSGIAFVTMDALHHRLVLFEVPDAVSDPDRRRHTGLQHVAFNYRLLDDLLGSYVRLKKLGILPVWAADHGVSMSIYYLDPDGNRIELNYDIYDDEWMGTEYMRSTNRAGRPAEFDPDKMVAARNAGATPWDLHQRGLAGEFAPAKPYDRNSQF